MALDETNVIIQITTFTGSSQIMLDGDGTLKRSALQLVVSCLKKEEGRKMLFNPLHLPFVSSHV